MLQYGGKVTQNCMIRPLWDITAVVGVSHTMVKTERCKYS